jgi:hypothetical protein
MLYFFSKSEMALFTSTAGPDLTICFFCLVLGLARSEGSRSLVESVNVGVCKGGLVESTWRSDSETRLNLISSYCSLHAGHLLSPYCRTWCRHQVQSRKRQGHGNSSSSILLNASIQIGQQVGSKDSRGGAGLLGSCSPM